MVELSLWRRRWQKTAAAAAENGLGGDVTLVNDGDNDVVVSSRKKWVFVGFTQRDIAQIMFKTF